MRADYSWLPDHQLHVAYTLAHADWLIDQAGNVLINYLRPGPFEFANVRDGESEHVKIASVAPLPEAVARLAADALNQLRAALEHTVFAEVEFRLGRTLNKREARSIEMPAFTKPDAFLQWMTPVRTTLLRTPNDGASLTRRIEALQPFHRQDFDCHLLRVLTEHTNSAKHRSPAVAATLVGMVVPDRAHPELSVPAAPERAAEVGDVIASAPVGEIIPLSVWPKVAMRRPHDGSWHVLMNELGMLGEWVRSVAVPHLILGYSSVNPLPPQLDTMIGHRDKRAALASAGRTPAATRSARRIQAESLRPELVDIFVELSVLPRETVSQWFEAISDDDLLGIQDRIFVAANRGHGGRALAETVRDLSASASVEYPDIFQ
ncbi:MAG: hypothetical protein PHN51_04915 [Candidatus Nanopelagicales bacterium]|nr:hypothetical protein [Candidatus Nanopelagicales bacterium]